MNIFKRLFMAVLLFPAAFSATAKHYMLIDFQGAYKPDGIRLTWSIVLTPGVVKGMENSKWNRDKVRIHMAPGRGYAAHLAPVKYF